MPRTESKAVPEDIGPFPHDEFGSGDLNVVLLLVVAEDLPISPRFTPSNF